MPGFEAAVIGAGVHGASAAYHLAQAGVRTVVVERGAPAGGPTGRSSAVCRAYYTNDFLARAARDSIRMLADFGQLVGGDSGYRRTGALFLHPPGDEAAVRATAARLSELEIPTEALSPEQVHERFADFDLAGIGVGAWEDDAGYADPAGTTRGLFDRAVALGAEARLHAAVARIDPRPGGGGTLVLGDGERIEADRVLLAAGPWTRPLAAELGVELPLTVERHVVATFRWGPARPTPLHADIPGGYYARPEGEQLYLVGPLHAAANADPDAFNQAIAPAEVADLSARVVRRIPQLDRSEAHGGWASLYDVSPDWQPVIGEIAPGVVVDAGTSGHGFKLAPALGSHVAALLMGAPVDAGIEAFHPRRFEEDRALAAGWGEARILG
jgi:glycine/D-amino acid oxidase-like deaminating enzyme